MDALRRVGCPNSSEEHRKGNEYLGDAAVRYARRGFPDQMCFGECCVDARQVLQHLQFLYQVNGGVEYCKHDYSGEGSTAFPALLSFFFLMIFFVLCFLPVWVSRRSDDRKHRAFSIWMQGKVFQFSTFGERKGCFAPLQWKLSKRRRLN
ncbi:T. brucei spp.-specific protein [Trypanosoma brucei gambiense DAL972]|uniref:T. brucei spp.-specific protein n=1 Tax=Trypanosoma brucei gambiense (strain MHOM/CI/86/DAL972) TaxID=679716 RepID=D0A3I7_TRYB9|nr:T. brucei spp.-specific protein [Trypanosoma brucei gambiense DAL972]CBH15831.1 T. brucei spp.-specific protein [Trypanosoma brucei gambiense DAL972]|eukprot:XP_011778095.1 T. brucei spp.-specific protein [Trypanosoma brucei gambiense DAL972]